MVSLKVRQAYHASRVYRKRLARLRDNPDPDAPVEPQSKFTNEFTSEFA